MSNRKQSFEEFLKEEFERAAESTQREVDESGVESIPDSVKKSIQEKLHEQIAAYEKEKVYAQLSEEDRKALELGKEMMRKEEEASEQKVEYRKKKPKFYLVLAAVLILVMALGVTSVGGPERVLRMVKSIVGEREVVKTNSSEENMIISEEDEEEAWQKIKETFGAEPVRIVNYPQIMMFEKLVLDPQMQTAEMIYKYDGKTFICLINAAYAKSSLGIDVEDKIINQYSIEARGVTIDIKEYEVKDTKEKHASAKFANEGLEYFLVGAINAEEMKKIVKNFYFP